MVIGRQILSYWVSVPFQNQTAKLPGWVSLVEMASFFEKIGRIFQAQTAPPSCAKPLTWQTNGLGALSQGFERLFHDLRLSSHVWDCLFDIKTVSPWFLVFVTHFLLEARKCKAAFLPWQNGKDLRNRERDSLKCKISLKFSASDSQPPNVQAPSNNFQPSTPVLVIIQKSHISYSALQVQVQVHVLVMYNFQGCPKQQKEPDALHFMTFNHLAKL